MVPFLPQTCRDCTGQAIVELEPAKFGSNTILRACIAKHRQLHCYLSFTTQCFDRASLWSIADTAFGLPEVLLNHMRCGERES